MAKQEKQAVTVSVNDYGDMTREDYIAKLHRDLDDSDRTFESCLLFNRKLKKFDEDAQNAKKN